jgi:hypothetical protein
MGMVEDLSMKSMLMHEETDRQLDTLVNIWIEHHKIKSNISKYESIKQLEWEIKMTLKEHMDKVLRK